MVINTKYSYGIALFTRKEKKLLLVRRRFTYAFTDFINGKYDDYILYNYINEMTLEEKLLILNNSFSEICKITEGFIGDRKSGIYYSFSRNQFEKNKEIYDNTKARDNGAFIKGLINKSKNVDLPWSIPKGRSNPGEKQLNTALREFQEETGLCEKDIIVDLNYDKFKITSIHNNIKYVSEFYIAFLKNEYVSYNQFYIDSKIKEISLIQFMGKIELSTKDRELYNKSKAIFQYV